MTIRNRKVAVIHDWLNGMRGGEKVLEAILDLFPNADIFTLFLDADRISDKIKSHPIVTSSLNKRNWIKKRYRSFLPMLPAAVESFDLKGYDLVISSSHCVAKGIIPEPDTLHVSYIHSPMRYIWDQYDAYFGHLKGLKRSIVSTMTSRLRVWDVTSAARVDRFIANSTFVRSRIQKFYRRDAAVLNPPIDTDFYAPAPKSDPPSSRDFFLTVSALVPYKRIDLLIEGFNRTGDKLVIIGKGPEEKRLKGLAKSNIHFKKDLAASELRDLYRNAKAFVYAGIEDFGMAFVEAMACGTPVVAFRRGGILDIVTDDHFGVLFGDQSVEALIQSLEVFKGKDYEPDLLRKRSLDFSEPVFKDRFHRLLEQAFENPDAGVK